MISEGQQVTYVGDDAMTGVGTRGSCLSMTGSSHAHVLWVEGAKTGVVEIVMVDDLLPYRTGHRAVGPSLAAEQMQDSLDMPPLTTVAARDTYDDLGEDGLITALDEHGHLAVLASYAEEAIGYVASRIRQDPGFGAVLSQLDADEADALAQRVASTVIADMVIGEVES